MAFNEVDVVAPALDRFSAAMLLSDILDVLFEGLQDREMVCLMRVAPLVYWFTRGDKVFEAAYVERRKVRLAERDESIAELDNIEEAHRAEAAACEETSSNAGEAGSSVSTPNGSQSP